MRVVLRVQHVDTGYRLDNTCVRTDAYSSNRSTSTIYCTHEACEINLQSQSPEITRIMTINEHKLTHQILKGDSTTAATTPVEMVGPTTERVSPTAQNATPTAEMVTSTTEKPIPTARMATPTAEAAASIVARMGFLWRVERATSGYYNGIRRQVRMAGGQQGEEGDGG